ncbi:MAG: CaiB/BaiF CoA-transferase family protein [Polyangiales bacterium]
MTAALDGVRVLDLSRVLAGPWATQTLADLGADVIKVERPGAGDDTRGWGPPYAKNPDGSDSDVSAYFLCANRNKRSITVDLAHPEGQRVVRELARRCDVVVENFKVGGLAPYGLDYASLSAINPGLVYCSITGFGQTGPYAQRAGYDFLIQAMGGLMSVTGEADGAPMKAGVALADVMTGLYATNAILAALFHKQRTGEGQHVDLALLDVQVAAMANQALNYLTTGVSPSRRGNAHPSIVPYDAFATRDGTVIVAVGNDAQFARLCAVIERPDLAADARYTTNAGRVRHRAEVIAELQRSLSTRDTDHWVSALESVGVPCGPVRSMAEVFADPQVIARRDRVELAHPRLGAVPSVANPARLSRTPVSYRSAPPDLGAHTDAVLRELLSLDDGAIASLRAAGAIGP